MEGITLGQLAGVIAFIVGVISGVGYLSSNLKRWISRAMDDQMKSLSSQMDTITQRLDQVDLESTKNFIVTYLSDVERGKVPDEIERERFWEQYQHYQKLGGNSYIKKKVSELEAKL